MSYPYPLHNSSSSYRRSSTSFPHHPQQPHSHHRAEDQQPSEAITATRRPTAPPELFPLGQIQQQAAAQAEIREASTREAYARAGAWAAAPTGPRGRGGSGPLQRGGAPPARGRGAPLPFIRPPRLNRGKSSVAGSWADAPPQGLPAGPSSAAMGNGKGKEMEQGVPLAGGGYAPFLASQKKPEQQPRATPIAVPQNPRATLFVRGLPPGTEETAVRRLFMAFGPIERISINHPKPNRTFAHVVYDSTVHATAALTALHNKPFLESRSSTPTASTSSAPSNDPPLLDVQYADPQAPKKASLSASVGSGSDAETGLFRARDTPAPAGQGVKAEPEASPAKAASSVPAAPKRKNRRKKKRGRQSEDGLVRGGMGSNGARIDEDEGEEEEDEVDQLEEDEGQNGQEAARSALTPMPAANTVPSSVLSTSILFASTSAFAPASTTAFPAASTSAFPPASTSAFAAVSTSTSSSAFASPAASPFSAETPFPGASQRPHPPRPASTLVFREDDGMQIEGVLLPPDCIGEDAGTTGRRMKLLLSNTKRLAKEGKWVLSNNIEGDYLMLAYQLDDVEGPLAPSFAGTPAQQITPASSFSSSASPAPLPPHPAPRPLSRSTTTSSAQQRLAELHVASPAPPSAPATATATAGQDIAMEDVKPIIPPSPARQSGSFQARMQIDEVERRGTPEEVVRFPLAIERQSRADRKDTSLVATGFIQEYFRRFDSARASLEALYDSNALFSLKLCTEIPARARSPLVPFAKAWHHVASKGVATTPTPITNQIRHLPAGSTDLDKLVFATRAVPEIYGGFGVLNGKKDKRSSAHPPIMLHILGEFEEFPEKIVRRFSRTFILVPKSTRATGTGGPEYWIANDQLTVLHKVEGEPKLLPTMKRLFTPSRSANPSPAASGSAYAGTPQPAGPRAPLASTSRLQQQAPQPQPDHPVASSSSRAPIAAATALPTHTSASTSDSTSRPPRPTRPRLPSPRPVDELILSDSDLDSLGLESLPPPIDEQRGNSTSSSSSSVSRSPELARRPIPSAPTATPQLVAQNSSSSKSLGKRRAVDDPDVSSSSSLGGGGLTSTGQNSHRAAHRPRTDTSFTVAQNQIQNQNQAQADEAERLSRDEIARIVQREVQAALKRQLGAGVSGVGLDAERVQGRVSKGKEAEKEGERKKDKEKSGKGKRKSKGVVEGEPEPELGTSLGRDDGRIVRASKVQSDLHGFDGKSNKLRHMIRTSPSSFLAASFVGDIVEFGLPSDLFISKKTQLVTSAASNDKFKVDEFAWSEEKETLVMGFLGYKEGREWINPPNQVVLYKHHKYADGTQRLVASPVTHKPHGNGGVTAVAALPSTKRLRFVTGGEDKKIKLWTRSRESQELSTIDIGTDHTSTITGLSYLPQDNHLVSVAKDKRLINHDLANEASVWQALLTHPVFGVTPVPSINPCVVLARMGAPSNQFCVYDLRRPATLPPVISFGYDLPPHTNARGASVASNLGRYLRGDLCDTVYAFPDHELGVKLWDLRKVGTDQFLSPLKTQRIPALGRSKVVHTAFASRSELCLMELSHLTRVKIEG